MTAEVRITRTLTRLFRTLPMSTRCLALGLRSTDAGVAVLAPEMAK